MRRILIGFVMSMALPIAGTIANAQQATPRAQSPATPGVASQKTFSKALETQITVRLERVSLQNALRAIAREANVQVTFAPEVYASRKRVTLEAVRWTASRAFREALRGTGLVMRVTEFGQAVFEVDTTAAVKEAEGEVSGAITDAKTGRAI